MRTSTSTSITDIDPRRLGRARHRRRLPSCAMRSSRRSKQRAASAAAPAGSRRPSRCTMSTASPPPRRPTSRPIPSANSSSISPGRRPTRSTVSPTTPSWCSACPSRRPPAPRLLVRPGSMPRATAHRTGRCHRGLRADARAFVRARAVRGRRRIARRFGNAGWLPRRRRAVPLGQPRLPRLRPLPRGLHRARSARRRGASAAASPKPASPSKPC